MIDYAPLYERMRNNGLARWLETLPALVEDALNPERHGHFAYWLEVLKQLPDWTPSSVDLNAARVRAGAMEDCSDEQRLQLEYLLQQFHPWRKGPFEFFGIHIDTEWRSDWKWDRLANAISPLQGRQILDVGCGNGYHCWRMAGAGAAEVIGIDPTLTSAMQFHVTKHFLGKNLPVNVLPVGIEAVPAQLSAFDTVFSMGVLYHRRSPLDHLLELRDSLRPGGELVLETLVVDGPEHHSLVPKDRYARMRNVWFIPSTATLEAWLQRCAYTNIRLVDVTPTTLEEQRSTDWMTFESLRESLDPEDHSLTLEGYPGPRRAIFIAEKPRHLR